ncbi:MULTISPECIES: oligopeptide/dipeptide ABC transporter ATP-binding protein [Paenibacillus]|uniref:Peptide ABC transporter ATPase n=1 Tax=Paenibacillus naphthalenovorans TaxID=162209 RepID=A0A0U2KWL9_9BACL|nr:MULTISPECIES: oligopeptide/dipeptide ABC transporter ATP-binding protein [Paenibacillus]ALS21106.1 peptide ABC transporter ATPase [Paenibacillus naphthalenovorans]NTZ18668.1 ABC transporter ATP-binding protein [Paenibacillus sp. JMULE4]
MQNVQQLRYLPVHEKPLIEVQELSKTYFQGMLKKKATKAVDGVSFSIRRGTSFGLIGESGSGKSTVGRMLLRLIKPTSGKIVYDGIDLVGLSGKELTRFRQKIQIVFQDSASAFNPRQMIGEQLAIPLWRFKKVTSQQQLNSRIGELLELVGLSASYANRFPHELSGGQRQRAGIARALSVEPEFLVLDEPVSALDVSVKSQIINLLKHLQEQLGLTYLFITHNLDIVSYLCDDVAVLYQGRIVEMGDTKTLFRNPCHPFTRELLGSILTLQGPLADYYGFPKKSDGSDLLESVLGWSGACPYMAKCPYHTTTCRTGVPELTMAGDNHYVRCFQMDQIGSEKEEERPLLMNTNG